MSRSTKSAKPYIVVFCEGESEQAYTDFLRKEFKDVASIHRPKATGLFDVADSKYKKDAKYRDYVEVTDEVWFFFDVETKDIGAWESRLKIIKRLRSLRKNPGIKVRLLMTTGCIEYWLMKREEVAENIRQCMQDVHQLASEARDAGTLLRQADDHFVNKREAAKTAISLTELDAMITQLLNYKDTICRRMEVMSASRQQEAPKPAPAATAKPGTPAPKPPKIMTVRRYDLCSVKRLQSKEDIDKYVEAIREKLVKTLESCDGVQIN